MAGDSSEEGQRTGDKGVALTGSVVYDKDLYGGEEDGGYVQSLGVGADDEQDEREQALSRC